MIPMGWLPSGDGVCDSCPQLGAGTGDQHSTIQRLRAAGWHHAAGQTLGGQSYEALLCPGCAREQKRRKQIKFSFEQQSLPMMQEELWNPAPKSTRGNDST